MQEVSKGTRARTNTLSIPTCLLIQPGQTSSFPPDPRPRPRHPIACTSHQALGEFLVRLARPALRALLVTLPALLIPDGIPHNSLGPPPPRRLLPQLGPPRPHLLAPVEPSLLTVHLLLDRRHPLAPQDPPD